MSTVIDVVTVFHCARNYVQHLELGEQLAAHHPDVDYRYIAVNNQSENRGFARGCNYGASQGDAPHILFLNPDATVQGPFLQNVVDALSQPKVVIAGERFGKPAHEVRLWGLRSWVCGACMGVNRRWFEQVGGFDERFVWGWDDSDLCRQAEACRLGIVELRLPVSHQSPDVDSPTDSTYKRHHFEWGAQLYAVKWRRP